MYLIGDIGNTEIKICLFNKNLNLIRKIRIKTNLLNKNYLSKNLKFINNYSLEIQKVLICSVVPLAYKKIKKFIEQSIKIKCIELKQLKLNNLLKIKVNKKQIGSDRIANAIGAYCKYKTNCIVLDFGTATTFDVIKNGVYLGGVIAPGIRLSLNTLISNAEQIPPFNLKKINKVIGNNTVNALRSGFYWGYAGLIENLLLLIKKHTKTKYKVILTGGFSLLFKNSIKSKVIVDRDITMKGLIQLLKL